MPDEKHVFQQSAQSGLALVGGYSTSKKRSRSPDRVSAGELSSKRQRKNVETRLSSGDKQARVVTKPAVKNVTALLENHLLWSQFRDEIRALEKNTLELVTQLRIETRLWRHKTNRLEKEINACRLKLDRRAGLKKCEISRRLQKFPWLKKTLQSVQTIENSEWEDLPTDITFEILRFLQEEDLFVLRGLSTQFYEAFYSQENYVHYGRCFRLAKRGRRFANLKFIAHSFDCIKGMCTIFGPDNFPKLEVLSLFNLSPRDMKPHPNIRHLRFYANELDDLKGVTDEKFPALKVLLVTVSPDRSWENANRFMHLPGHKSLTHFGFWQYSEPLTLMEIKVLTKVKFPQLRVLAICMGETLPQVVHYVSQQNFEFFEHIGEFIAKIQKLFKL